MMSEIYRDYQHADQEFRTKRERLEKLIQSHRRSLAKLERNSPGWYKDVVVPLADTISRAIEMPYEIYGPLGLSCHTSIYFFVNGSVGSITENPTLGLTVYPDFRYTNESTSFKEFVLLYDTGERTRNYADYTIGELNDGNVVKAPLPDDLEEIVALLRRSH